MRTRVAVGLVALVSSLVTGACSDGEGDTTTSTTGGAGDLAAYCGRSLGVETFPTPGVDLAALTPDQQREEAKKYASSLKVAFDAVGEVAPKEVAPHIGVLADTVGRVAASGDLALTDGPEFESAERRKHAYDLEQCSWGRVEVTAVEYAYQGAPPVAVAGPISFDMTNAGKEQHELLIARINDGVTMVVSDLFARPPEELRALASASGRTAAEPGGTGYDVVNLDPGRYAIACLLPVGGAPGAPPHASRGMYAELRVEGGA